MFCIRPPYTHSTACKRKRPFARRLSTVAAAVLSLCIMLFPAHAEIFDQYQVKAVFLYNLTNFIKWPAAKHHDANQPFIIAVMGRDNLGSYLNEAVSKESVNSRRVVLKRYKGLDELRRQPCDLLFVGEDQHAIWPQIRAVTRQHTILTVSDVEGFAHRGGIVNLLTSGRKIRIEINIEEAKRNGFEVSAKLLRLSHIIDGGKDK